MSDWDKYLNKPTSSDSVLIRAVINTLLLMILVSVGAFVVSGLVYGIVWMWS